MIKLLLCVSGWGAGHGETQQLPGAQPLPAVCTFCFVGCCGGWQRERVQSPSESLPMAHRKQEGNSGVSMCGPGIKGPKDCCGGGSVIQRIRCLNLAASCPWLGLPVLEQEQASHLPSPAGASPVACPFAGGGRCHRQSLQVGGCVPIHKSRDLFWLWPRSSHRSPEESLGCV